MTTEEFKRLISAATTADDIDLQCLTWLRHAAQYNKAQLREMMMSALEIVEKGME